MRVCTSVRVRRSLQPIMASTGIALSPTLETMGRGWRPRGRASSRSVPPSLSNPAATVLARLACQNSEQLLNVRKVMIRDRGSE